MPSKYPCIYIMTNRKNGPIYIDITTDLIRRVHEHKNNVIPGFTSQRDLYLVILNVVLWIPRLRLGRQSGKLGRRS